MNQHVAVADVTFPTGSRVWMRIEVSTDFNVSAQVARQKANRFLIMSLGDQLWVGDPELIVGPRLFWRMPVHLTLSRGGYLGQVGNLRVDAQTGDITVEPPQTLKHLADQAEVLYERAAFSPGDGE